MAHIFPDQFSLATVYSLLPQLFFVVFHSYISIPSSLLIYKTQVPQTYYIDSLIAVLYILTLLLCHNILKFSFYADLKQFLHIDLIYVLKSNILDRIKKDTFSSYDHFFMIPWLLMNQMSRFNANADISHINNFEIIT